jgi:hypothetical protein
MVLVLVAASITSCSLDFGRPARSVLKTPAGWKRTEEQAGDQGALALAYKGSATPQEALETFGASLEEAGWQLVEPAVTWTGAPALFVRGDQQAEVMVIGGDDAAAVFVLVSPKPAEELEPPLSPAQDAAGHEIEGLSRYPGAVLARYEAGPDGQLLEYVTAAGVQQVADYYAGLLSTNGWRLQSSANDDTFSEMAAVREATGLVQVRVALEGDPPGNVRITLELTTLP